MKPEQQSRIEHRDGLAQNLATIGVIGIALIHFLDVFSKFKETPYLGVLYVALILGCVTAVGLMLAGRTRQAWILVAAAAALPFAGYALSRTTGLPSANGDIGNWEEPLGLASLFVEGSLVLLSAWVLSGYAQTTRRLAARRPGVARSRPIDATVPRPA